MKYSEPVYITKEIADKIEQVMTYKHTGVSFGKENTYTVRAEFPDGMEMEITCWGALYDRKGCISRTPCAEAVLYRENTEVASSIAEIFTKEWKLVYDGNEYIADVVAVNSEIEKMIDTYKRRKLYEYEEASERLNTLLKSDLRSLSRILDTAKKEDVVVVSDSLIFEIITQLEQVRRHISNGNKFAEMASYAETIKNKE